MSLQNELQQRLQEKQILDNKVADQAAEAERLRLTNLRNRANTDAEDTYKRIRWDLLNKAEKGIVNTRGNRKYIQGMCFVPERYYQVNGCKDRCSVKLEQAFEAYSVALIKKTMEDENLSISIRPGMRKGLWKIKDLGDVPYWPQEKHYELVEDRQFCLEIHYVIEIGDPVPAKMPTQDRKGLFAHAWRIAVQTFPESGIRPRDYETKHEYESAINEYFYGWRKKYKCYDYCHIRPQQFETEKAFLEAMGPI